MIVSGSWECGWFVLFLYLFLGVSSFPLTSVYYFYNFFKTAYFQKKGGEVKEEMRNFFAMEEVNKTSSQLLAEGPTTYKWQTRFNAAADPHLRSCYSFLHFRAALWSPIAPVCFIRFIKGRQKAGGDWQQTESGFCSFRSSLSPLHSRQASAQIPATGKRRCSRRVYQLRKQSSASDTALKVFIIPLWLSPSYAEDNTIWTCRFSVYLSKLMFRSWI